MQIININTLGLFNQWTFCTSMSQPISIYHVIANQNLTCHEHTAWMTPFEGANDTRFQNMLVGIFIGMIVHTLGSGVQKILIPFVLRIFKKEISWHNLKTRLNLQTKLLTSLYMVSNILFICGHLAHASCAIPYLAYYTPEFLFLYLLNASLFTSAQNILMVSLLEIVTVMTQVHPTIVTLRKCIHYYVVLGPTIYTIVAVRFILFLQGLLV